MNRILKYVHLLLLFMLAILLPYSLNSSFAASAENEHPDKFLKIILYANNTLFRMNPDGSAREKLFEKADVLDFHPLADGRILVLSSQYDGESLEIFDPSNGIWGLVEFTEGEIPNIAISDDGFTIAYEVRHFPIAIEMDGVWLYDARGKKTHAKIANTALTIESFTIHANKLYLLYHELDLVSDEAGLFTETIFLDGSSKTRKNRTQEGLKMYIESGYSLGFTYPTSGKKLEMRNLTNDAISSIAAPSGDITLYKTSHLPGENPMYVFRRKALNFTGEEFEEFLLWDIRKAKLSPLKFGERADVGDFRWSSDGWLYFSAKYIDRSGGLSSPMIFRMKIGDKNIELVIVLGGPFVFQE